MAHQRTGVGSGDSICDQQEIVKPFHNSSASQLQQKKPLYQLLAQPKKKVLKN